MIASVARELERRTAGDQLHPDLPRSVHARDEGHRAPVLRDRRCVLDPGPVRQAMHANYRRRRRRDREARDCEREDACRDGNNRSERDGLTARPSRLRAGREDGRRERRFADPPQLTKEITSRLPTIVRIFPKATPHDAVQSAISGAIRLPPARLFKWNVRRPR